MVGENVPTRIIKIPDHFMTQEMCKEAICEDPYVFFLVPDHFEIQEICNEAVCVDPSSLEFVLDHLKAQKKFNAAETHLLYGIPLIA